ncbi:hypothetical protein ROZALSC1DRAFT_27476 [Rozella allomycis CSF55]|uniref:Endonuclease/exonuclease/phosphatase domain-containing protein n=1 Tax=Rozella allomycis (strain CSF55) TaxID=988480 RepID=A0A075AZ60_ROZAC|nr:Endonuclease/exonuclease/phosphatase domain-containing protein [Rozella allomycis CSF55]RKP21079.1 hypothetical protein ROZALSC1DRAFT_27476 [Rozella allomycis CSF55]|eukprot:EPZ33854.1 Endonuclease/exonuclease/phosphatase domain-containing protein [Rozella allomycis CSF55]
MQPGDLITYDFRIQPSSHIPNSPTVLQFNIERGYQLSNILRLLLSHPSDILCLQELDIQCERTQHIDIVKYLAKELQMKAAFVVEFVEEYHEKRSKYHQGGGVHGNAILSKYDFDPRVIEHEHQPFDWVSNGLSYGEPRQGGRYTIIGDFYFNDKTKLTVYSAHLEPFCGMIGRLLQFSEIARDVAHQKPSHPFVIAGDLNTLGHGLARFSPRYCNDRMRFYSFGWTESEFWLSNILCFQLSTDDKNDERYATRKMANRSHFLLDPASYTYLMSLDVIETFDGMEESFKIKRWLNVYKAKLDWMLVHRMKPTLSLVLNNDYSASDHKALFARFERIDSSDDWEIMATKWRNSWAEHGRRKRLALFGSTVLATFGLAFLALRRLYLP